jgi:hypothetical protein
MRNLPKNFTLSERIVSTIVSSVALTLFSVEAMQRLSHYLQPADFFKKEMEALYQIDKDLLHQLQQDGQSQKEGLDEHFKLAAAARSHFPSLERKFIEKANEEGLTGDTPQHVKESFWVDYLEKLKSSREAISNALMQEESAKAVATLQATRTDLFATRTTYESGLKVLETLLANMQVASDQDVEQLQQRLDQRETLSEQEKFLLECTLMRPKITAVASLLKKVEEYHALVVKGHQKCFAWEQKRVRFQGEAPLSQELATAFCFARALLHLGLACFSSPLSCLAHVGGVLGSLTSFGLRCSFKWLKFSQSGLQFAQLVRAHPKIHQFKQATLDYSCLVHSYQGTGTCIICMEEKPDVHSCSQHAVHMGCLAQQIYQRAEGFLQAVEPKASVQIHSDKIYQFHFETKALPQCAQCRPLGQSVSADYAGPVFPQVEIAIDKDIVYLKSLPKAAFSPFFSERLQLSYETIQAGLALARLYPPLNAPLFAIQQFLLPIDLIFHCADLVDWYRKGKETLKVKLDKDQWKLAHKVYRKEMAIGGVVGVVGLSLVTWVAHYGFGLVAQPRDGWLGEGLCLFAAYRMALNCSAVDSFSVRSHFFKQAALSVVSFLATALVTFER